MTTVQGTGCSNGLPPGHGDWLCCAPRARVDRRDSMCDILIYFDSCHRVAFLPQTAFRAELSGHPLAVWPSSFWDGVSRPRSKGRAGHRLHWYVICIIAGMFSRAVTGVHICRRGTSGPYFCPRSPTLGAIRLLESYTNDSCKAVSPHSISL